MLYIILELSYLVLHYLLSQLYELRHFRLVSEEFAKLHRTPPFFNVGYSNTSPPPSPSCPTSTKIFEVGI